MSCHLDLAEIFGDETIEVVTVHSKGGNNYDTVVECGMPTCVEVCGRFGVEEIEAKTDKADEREEANDEETQRDQPEVIEPFFDRNGKIRVLESNSNDSNDKLIHDESKIQPIVVEPFFDSDGKIRVLLSESTDSSEKKPLNETKMRSPILRS